MAYGQSGHLAINYQNSFGVSQTGSPFFIPLVSETIGETIAQMVEGNMYGRFAESPTHEGMHGVEGEIRAEAHPIALGTFLKAALGRVTTTSQGSAFVHEFLPAVSDWDSFAALPPMTVEVYRDAGSAFLYYDLLGTTLGLEIAHGQLLTANLAVKGGRFSQAARQTPAFPAGRPWSWDVASASYDGVAITDLRQISLVFENQLAPQHTLSGGKYPFRIKRDGPQTVSVEGTMLFQDQVLFKEFRAQTEKRFLLNFGGETVATSYRTELSVDLPRLRFSEFSPQLSGAGQMAVNFSGKGVYDSGSSYALRITLTNTKAGY